MIPASWPGLASKLDGVLAWWRAHLSAKRETPWDTTQILQLTIPEAADTQTSGTHAVGALRRFTTFALDEAFNHSTGVPGVDGGEPLLEAIAAVLERLELHAKYLPRRPSLLPKLLSAINNNSNSMSDLAAIIGEDPALGGNLLRVANSSFYRVNNKPVDSFERAVTLVGIDGIRSVIATALLQPVMTESSGPFAKFPETIWEQTQYSAAAAEIHATHVEDTDAFSARLLALLHGLATNTVFRIVRDESLARGEVQLNPGVVADLLDRWVTPTALRIAESWELPDPVCSALAANGGEQALGRSLHFGRLAGAQILLVMRGRVKESAARATLLAGDSRRMRIDRVWSRLASAWLVPRN
jgi:HD-like signal output (HDOD) protein